MKLQGRNLHNGDQGEDVSLLQKELEILGFHLIAKARDTEITPKIFGPHTLVAIREIQEKAGLPVTGVVDEATARVINERVDGTTGGGGGGGKGPFVVKGRITTADGQPAPRVRVRAFDRGLRSEKMLGETLSGAAGDYEIRYRQEDLRKPDRGAADLLVRALPQGSPAVESAVRFRASRTETIDLVLASLGPSEYELLLAALSGVLEGVAPKDLTTAEVLHLAGLLGREPAHVGFAVSAERLAGSTGLPASVFYAFARRGLPSALPSLLAQPLDRLQRELEAALGANLVPATLRNRLPEILDLLRELILRQASVTPTGGFSLTDLLATVLPSEQVRRRFLDLYIRHRGPIRDFWANLHNNPEFAQPGAVEALQLTLQLGVLSGNHLPLVQALQQRGVRTARDLARISGADWQSLIDQHGVPPSTPGANASERAANYRGAIQQLVDAAFPTAALGRELAADPAGDAGAKAFFSDHPDFEFGTVPVRQLLGGQPAGEAVLQQLEGMERIFQVTPGYAPVKALIDAGFDSASRIAQEGPDTFVRRFATTFGGPAEALQVFERADHNTAVVSTVFGAYAPPFWRDRPGVIVSGPVDPDTDPDWRSLFGSLDLCACRHCRSVLSAAAYLDDLLGTLQKWNVAAALRSRRPDLFALELSCANTDTTLPYIDLVNELLESAVLPSSLPVRTEGTAAELRIQPQVLSSAAYEKLRGEHYPWGLPFDLWETEAGLYLDRLGTRRHELMAAFRNSETPSGVAIAANRLGLNATELGLLTRPVPAASAWELYGFASEGAWLQDLSGVAEFLKRTGLSYGELAELLRLRLVNPDHGIDIQPKATANPDTCDPEELEIHSWSPTRLDLLQRFVRLRRRIGWTAWELDRTIAALQPGTIDGDLLVALARLGQLSRELRLPPRKLLVFYGRIDTYVYLDGVDRPLYNELFLNPAVYKAPEGQAHPLALGPDLGELEHTGRRLAEPAPAAVLRGALSLSEADWNTLLADPLAAGDGKLTLWNVTRLTRTVFLARGLRLPVADLLRLLPFSGESPFSEAAPGDLAVLGHTLDFVATVRKLRESGVPLAETFLLLTGARDPASPATPPDEALAKLLTDLRTALQDVIVTTSAQTDPDGSLTARALTLLEWEPALIENVMATLLGRQPYAEPLPELPKDLEFPLVLAGKVSYDKEAKALRFQGPMSKEDHQVLSDLATGDDYRSAVQKLYDAPRTLILKHLGSFGLTAADVAAMFDDPAAPAATLAARFDRLLGPLQALLRRTQSKAITLETVGTALGLDAATAESLLGTWLRAPSLQAPAGTKEPILQALLDPDFIAGDPSAFQRLVESLSLAFRAAYVLQRLGLDSRDLPVLFRRAAAGGWLDLNELPLEATAESPQLFAAWVHLLDVVRLRNRLPRQQPPLLDLLERALAASPGPATVSGPPESFLADLAALTGWRREDLQHLAGQAATAGSLGLRFPEDWRTGEAFARIADCFDLLRRLGAKADEAATWSQDGIQEAAVLRLRQILKTRTEGAAWIEIAGPLRDSLREKQRDALVAFLVPRPDAAKNQRWTDVNGLFSHFLIDVEMSSCQLTSRLKQALSSVQLFVQRCLMNLEEGIHLPQEAPGEWQWRKSYRVWEANRKVYLYPENWIEPELRDDKSPFFQELENELLQGDVTDAAVEQAVRAYLDKLHDVGRLLLVAMCLGPEISPTLHVFGRTRGEPRQYFYRRWVGRTTWTPWEPVNVHVEGDHLIPIVHNRRLYLFWALFTAVPDENQTSGTAAKKHWEIRLAWSERRNGKWTPKKETEEALSPFLGSEDLKLPLRPDGLPFKDSFRFRADSQGGRLRVRLYGLFEFRRGGSATSFPAGLYPLSAWLLLPCDGTLELLPQVSNQEEVVLVPQNTYVQAERFRQGTLFGWFFIGQNTDDELALFEGPFVAAESPDETGQRRKDFNVLATTPGTFELLFPHHTPQPDAWQPFFYQDDRQTFFVLPEVSGADVGQEQSWGRGDVNLGQIGALSFNTATPSLGIANRNLAESAQDVAEVTIWTEFSFPEPQPQITLTFHLFHHPQVCRFIEALEAGGMAALFGQPARETDVPIFDGNAYKPLPVVNKPYPVEAMDFCPGGACSLYNWELFFHIPLLVADRLSKNQRFEEARRWFHFIFDPTDATAGADPHRFWKFKPFAEDSACDPSLDLLRLLGRREPLTSRERAALDRQIGQWQEHPFQPHAIARLRWSAYQKTVVMKYLDNLIAWGDNLFQRDTLETLNEATQLYVLAADILGNRPREIPPRHEAAAGSHDHPASGASPLAFLENLLPGRVGTEITWGSPTVAGPSFPGPAATPPSPASLFGQAGSFCLPGNEKLSGYWDTVADRLFKIRHCMNIEGIVRQLPLFEPPIDPALLVRAAAAGLDPGTVLSGLAVPRPPYRFATLAQKATELCSEVKALGAALLSALEKKDAEELALLRSGHELALLGAVRQVKEQQVAEAETALAALRAGREVVNKRWQYYRDIKQHSLWELSQMGLMVTTAALQFISKNIEAGAAVVQTAVPDAIVGGAGSMGTPVALVAEGGTKKAETGSRAAKVFQVLAEVSSLSAQMVGLEAGFQRRWDEWKLQERLAEQELLQLDQQILAAEIRHEITRKELDNHDLQVENAREMDAAMREKFTNRELYAWMVGQISGIYFQSYRLAHDVARRAERAYRHELALPNSNFIQFGSWDSLKKGLLAGERLFHDVKRLEVAYLDQHRRELEITKHVSVARLDPLALVELRRTGSCIVRLPEALFDLDFPGHYLRRIKTVSVSVPCVTGPYTGVPCTLTLLRSTVRHGSTLLNDSYRRQEDDPRFTDNLGAIESVATSSGQNDSGLFETNLRDERFLPFEGAGVISEWQIELPAEFRSFDYDTISDVLLHLRYTARSGGKRLADQVKTELSQALNEMARSQGEQGLAQLISVRHDMPTEWHRFLQGPAESSGFRKLTLDLGKERFPYLFATSPELRITGIELFLQGEQDLGDDEASLFALTLSPPGGEEKTLTRVAWEGLLRAVHGPAPQNGLGPWTLRIQGQPLHNVLVVCHYTVAPEADSNRPRSSSSSSSR
ncbi:MAG TPA: hypothetical protein DD490_12505 [Acidobacteria bacterium]|nr:hypothetical protein [Acidobacteriota bacterium]